MGCKLANAPRPSDLRIRRILSEQRLLAQRLLSIRSTCQHNYLPVRYTESDVGGGYQVGIFDTTLVCRKCTHQAVLKASAPICSCCGFSLELKVWEGKPRNSATNRQIGMWKREYQRRRKLMSIDILAHGMFFSQFGLYLCTNEKCRRNGKVSFYITGGD